MAMKGMYDSKQACASNHHMRADLAGHRPAANNLSMPAHQMVGGYHANKPVQGMINDKVQENRKPEVRMHAEPVRVSMSTYVGKGNKIC